MRSTAPMFTLALTMLAAGCSRAMVIESPFEPVPPTAVVYQDDSGALGDSTETVVRDEGAWIELWTQITENQLNPPDRPAVDFTTHMLLAVAAGRMRAGDQIHVDSAGVRNDVFYAFVGLIGGCETIDVDVYPLEIVRVARSERTVQFLWQRRNATCGP